MENTKNLKEEKVEWKKLEEVCKFQNGFAFPSNLFSSTGIPVIKINNISDGKVKFDNYKCFESETLGINLEEYKILPNDILITMTGTTKIGYNYSENIGYLNQRVGKIIPFPEKIKNRFLFHLLLFFENKIYKLATGAGPRPNLSAEQIKSFKVPLPPLKKQAKIAAVLDKFTELTEELTEELTAREAQYNYYRDMLLSEDYLNKILSKKNLIKKQLNEIAKLKRGKRLVRKELEKEGKYPVFQNSLTPLGYYNRKNNDGGKTCIISAGSAGEIFYQKKDFWAADDVFVIVSDSVLNKYLYYYLINKQNLIKTNIRKGTISRLPKEVLENLEILIPPIEIQNEIVNILDNFETLVNDIRQGLPREIELRQKQYEYYREKLLTFE